MKIFIGIYLFVIKSIFLNFFRKGCVFMIEKIFCFLWLGSMVLSYGFYVNRRNLRKIENISFNVLVDIERVCFKRLKV